MEIWKDIPGYEGLYKSTKHGDILSIERPGTKGGLLSKHKDKKGYERVLLTKQNKPRTVAVHRLVGITFIANPERKPTINHIDGNKLNNNSENLEWCTNLENMRHANSTGLREGILPKGENHHKNKYKEEDIREAKRLINEGQRLVDISNKLGIDYATIKKVKQGKNWKHI